MSGQVNATCDRQCRSGEGRPARRHGIGWRDLRGMRQFGCCAAAVSGTSESADTAQGRPGPSVVDTALSFQGTPYRAAGADPSGFDCSGLVQYVFWQHGVAMPRTVAEQFRAGRQVERRPNPARRFGVLPDWRRHGVTRGYRRRRWAVRARAEGAWHGARGVARGAVLGDAIRRRTAHGQKLSQAAVATGAVRLEAALLEDRIANRQSSRKKRDSTRAAYAARCSPVRTRRREVSARNWRTYRSSLCSASAATAA